MLSATKERATLRALPGYLKGHPELWNNPPVVLLPQVQKLLQILRGMRK